MLHFRPDLVNMDAAENFRSAAATAEEQLELLRPTGTHAFAWIASDLNPGGVVGKAAKATAEKGRADRGASGGRLCATADDMRKAKLADWLTRRYPQRALPGFEIVLETRIEPGR